MVFADLICSRPEVVSTMRLLLIAQDSQLTQILQQCLTRDRYIVDLASDGELGWEYTQSNIYDLLLIEIDLPQTPGIRLCERLRGRGCHTPILLIAAENGSHDGIRGLDVGADDYWLKSANLEELQARVRALLRRQKTAIAMVLTAGALCLDPYTHQVTYDNQPLTLTPKEYAILELFLRHPQQIFSCQQMIAQLWSLDDPPQAESVKSHIKSLRQKLKQVGAVHWIENIYGMGYRFNVPVAAIPAIPDDQPLDVISLTPLPQPRNCLSSDSQTIPFNPRLRDKNKGFGNERSQAYPYRLYEESQ
jgi:DNA-binding response OmpR family regulator